MAVFTPPGFWDFIMDLDGDGINDIEQFVEMRKNQLENKSGSPQKKPAVTRRIPVVKKTRKVSRYQKASGRHLKALKKKHPRTDISVLMKKAHRLTRKELR